MASRAKRSPNILCPRPNAVKAVRGSVQLALRVSSISVTVITYHPASNPGCSLAVGVHSFEGYVY